MSYEVYAIIPLLRLLVKYLVQNTCTNGKSENDWHKINESHKVSFLCREMLYINNLGIPIPAGNYGEIAHLSKTIHLDETWKVSAR